MAADLTQFKDVLQESVAIAAPQVHALWVESLMAGADLDDYRKYMEFAAKVTGANVDPKADANAGLAVFHFHMDGGGMTAQIQAAPAQPLELVEEISQQQAQPICQVNPAPETEPVDIQAELDALLGGHDDA